MGGYTAPPPSKNTILGRSRAPGPCVRRISEKKWGNPPRRMVQRGGCHSFSDFGDNRVWLPGTLLKNWSKQGVHLFEYVQNRPSGWPLSSPNKGRLRFSAIPYTPRGAPLRNTIPGKIPGTRTISRRISEKSGRNPPPPPANGPAGGCPLFSDFCDNRVWLPGTLLKNWSKQGVPPF